MASQPSSEAKQAFAQTLKQVPFFASLTDDILLEMAKSCLVKHYAKEQFIFLEGETCPGLFVVHQGAVKIFKFSEGGREQVLAIEREGRPIAELPAFDELPYPASARAVEEATLLLLPKDQFRRLFFKYPEIAMGVVRSLSMRLRKMVGLVEELAFKEVSQRVAHFLLDIAEKWGQRTPEGIVFELRPTNQEIAARIGTVRELVSRCLSRFRDMGIISIQDRTVTVHDLNRLRAQTEGGK
ncbi:MAG: Crp/Fnr family transcriptional regulator [Acidobacteria bacterium]|nr:Crp/Fnr family transcriptional regulator [Acidobacteriota bacterium]